MLSEAQSTTARDPGPVVGDRSASAMARAAAAYARAGFPVFPCREISGKGAKAPYTAHGWKDASCDPARVADWWAEWPNAGIGFPTGPATGTLVVDLDPKGSDIYALLRAVKLAIGGRLAAAGLPGIARTQGGGLHLYYAWPGGADITIGVDLFDAAKEAGDKALALVDWRGEGGYVIAPPSRMDNGRSYEWMVKPPRGEGRAWALPAPPGALLERILAKRRKPAEAARSAPARPFRAAGEDRVARYVQAAVTNILSAAAGAPEGRRNAEVFTAALKLGDFVRGGFLSRSEAEAQLLAHLPLGVSPGEKKIRETIANGLERGDGVFTPDRMGA